MARINVTLHRSKDTPHLICLPRRKHLGVRISGTRTDAKENAADWFMASNSPRRHKRYRDRKNYRLQPRLTGSRNGTAWWLYSRVPGDGHRYGIDNESLQPMPLPIHWQTAANVRFADICKRLETATLVERLELLTFVRLHIARIRPRISDRWLILEMLKYFLECIGRAPHSETDTEEEDFDSPFDAARQLVRWFNWYRNVEKEGQRIQNVANLFAEHYRSGTEFSRNCFETGFLEHALETPENRPYFRSWAEDPVLADAHRESLKWGLAHEIIDKP